MPPARLKTSLGQARNDPARSLNRCCLGNHHRRQSPPTGERHGQEAKRAEIHRPNRAPRVQIEYDVEIYGSEKKVQIPFVMGVLADLSGKPADALPDVADRKFLEIDIDNFDARMKSMKPRVAFPVPNTLTGDGQLAVDITFDSMDDFSPAAVARKVTR